jgi:hypothetical protein
MENILKVVADMHKDVVVTFSLTDDEIKEAIYDFYIRKLESNNINASLSKEDITFNESILYISLKITDRKEID